MSGYFPLFILPQRPAATSLLPSLNHAKLTLLGLEAHLHQAVLLLGLGRLGLGHNPTPLVHLEILPREATRGVVSRAMHHLSPRANALHFTAFLNSTVSHL